MENGIGGTWVPIRKASDFYGVSKSTLRRWADTNFVKTKRSLRDQRLFLISSEISTNKTLQNQKNYIYVRVSSKKQCDDLERQSAFLSNKYPDHVIIKDIGSGLNYKRRGLLKLLEKSNKNEVNQVVVYSKDRLCRFGFELFEWLFKQNNTELVVYEQSDKSPEQEFTEDILAILQVFACRWNGKRTYRIDKNNEIQIETFKEPEKNTKSL